MIAVTPGCHKPQPWGHWSVYHRREPWPKEDSIGRRKYCPLPPHAENEIVPAWALPAQDALQQQWQELCGFLPPTLADPKAATNWWWVCRSSLKAFQPAQKEGFKAARMAWSGQRMPKEDGNSLQQEGGSWGSQLWRFLEKMWDMDWGKLAQPAAQGWGMRLG